MHFITNGYKTLFKDKLDRSKATCSFKINQAFVYSKTEVHGLFANSMPGELFQSLTRFPQASDHFQMGIFYDGIKTCLQNRSSILSCLSPRFLGPIYEQCGGCQSPTKQNNTKYLVFQYYKNSRRFTHTHSY